MIPKEKNYRVRLPQELFDRAQAKAHDEDLNLAQVVRRLLSAWINGEIKLSSYKGVLEEE